MQKKILMNDKEILLITKIDIGKKILISFKESLHSTGNLVNSHQNQSKYVIRGKCLIFCKKCVNFCKKCVNFDQNFLASPKLSWN